MHFRTHVKDEHRGLSGGQGEYADGMIEHDMHVGMILDKLDELGIADDTIVMYSTDNGPHYNSWPDAAISPFRSEKNSNWEGAYRVPCFLRWPGHYQAGVTLNGIVAHQDMLTTFLAAAGEPDIVGKCKAGHQAAGKTFRVVLDGKDMNGYFAGESDTGPRQEFFYVNDDAQLVALRMGDWKLTFLEQRAKTAALWAEPFVELRIPRIFNLRRDPFERAIDNSNTYWDWMIDHIYMMYLAQATVAKAVQELAEFPPRQKPAIIQLGPHPGEAAGVGRFRLTQPTEQTPRRTCSLTIEVAPSAYSLCEQREGAAREQHDHIDEEYAKGVLHPGGLADTGCNAREGCSGNRRDCRRLIPGWFDSEYRGRSPLRRELAASSRASRSGSRRISAGEANGHNCSEPDANQSRGRMGNSRVMLDTRPTLPQSTS